MSAIEIKPTHNAFDEYYTRLNAIKQGLQLSTEGSTRRAFSALLDATASVKKWTLAEEVSDKRKGKRIRLDGILYDAYRLPRGYWEAKDKHDDLEAEILSKQAKDYPISNIIFEDTERAVLIQDGVRVFDVDMFNRAELARLLTRFYNYDLEPFEKFAEAVSYFTNVIPDIGKGLKQKIEIAHKENKAFQNEFADFMELCRTSLNPNIAKEAVDEMLIQHLLTERLIRKIFQGDFTRRNIIANKVEDVIGALTKPLFDRSEFQAQLDPFYNAIENAANTLADSYQDKQRFINTVYEQFFQGYSVKVADTHGIVYTPQEIVDFMCAAVEEVLHDEFGKKLGEDGVTVLDPATGTGNFIINLLNRVDERYRRDFYKNHLFANEVMLMPYYIASLNVEHAYYELEGQYEPFEGLCFVDTLDLAKKKQMQFSFMTEANTARVQRQQDADITVIIGNPPYNMQQLNANDNNQNRGYEIIDERVGETYSKDSQSNNRNALYDPYVKFFRWATDRLGNKDGIVCYITNNGFVDGKVFNGMRKHLMQDFHRIFHLDLHGNVRQNPKISGTTHNVFGIQVGVGITVAIRNSKYADHKLFYHRVPEFWTAIEKLSFLADHVERQGKRNLLNTVEWSELYPDRTFTWLVPENTDEFEEMIPIGLKEAKKLKAQDAKALFHQYARGILTSRDTTVYDYNRDLLGKRVKTVIHNYNAEVDRYKRENKPDNVDDFVNSSQVDWSYWLKQHLKQCHYIDYSAKELRNSLYRPFSRQHLYFNNILVNSPTLFPYFFPNENAENENRLIWIKVGSAWSMFALISNVIVDALPQSGSQCFPFYVYDEDGTHRRENITDWALNQFRTFYQDASITKWDIFYYVYALLHHPAYRERYADNLKRELPRIPFVPKSTGGTTTDGIVGATTDGIYPIPTNDNHQSASVGTTYMSSVANPPTDNISSAEEPGNNGFRAFSRAGKKLADMHLNYETYKQYPVQRVRKQGVKINNRVEKMRPKNKRKVALSTIFRATTDGIYPIPTNDESVGTTYMSSAANPPTDNMPSAAENETNAALKSPSPLVGEGDLGGEGSTITVFDTLEYNESLTLTGIPEKAFAYRLGNRSALEWVIDQYQVKTDSRSGITSDPNGYSDDDQYIINLVERVIQVSVDTVAIVDELARWAFRE